MQPGAIGRPAARGNWPSVLGTILIVFGCGGVTGGLVGIASPYIHAWVMSLAPQANPTLEVMSRWATWTILSSLAALLVAVLLPTGGILLLRRRRRAVRMLRVWAVLKIIYAVLGMWLGLQIQGEEPFVVNGPDPGRIGMPLGRSFFTALGVAGICIGLIWAWALPGFVLIWLGRRKIQDETGVWP